MPKYLIAFNDEWVPEHTPEHSLITTGTAILEGAGAILWACQFQLVESLPLLLPRGADVTTGLRLEGAGRPQTLAACRRWPPPSSEIHLYITGGPQLVCWTSKRFCQYLFLPSVLARAPMSVAAGAQSLWITSATPTGFNNVTLLPNPHPHPNPPLSHAGG